MYDPSTKHYWTLKRPLSNAEWKQFNALKAEKYTTQEALEKLGAI